MDQQVIKSTVTVLVQRKVECVRVATEGFSIGMLPTKGWRNKGRILVLNPFMYPHQMTSYALGKRDSFFDARKYLR